MTKNSSSCPPSPTFAGKFFSVPFSISKKCPWKPVPPNLLMLPTPLTNASEVSLSQCFLLKQINQTILLRSIHGRRSHYRRRANESFVRSQFVTILFSKSELCCIYCSSFRILLPVLTCLEPCS